MNILVGIEMFIAKFKIDLTIVKTKRDFRSLSTRKFPQNLPEKKKSLFHSVVLIVLLDLGKTCADSLRGELVLELSNNDNQP